MLEVLPMKRLLTLGLVSLVHALWPLPAAAQPYDLANGNAAVEIVIPAVAPVIFLDVSNSGGDATLVLRVTTLVTNAWFDATAPYHPSAVGVYSRLGRRPAAEALTNENINTALLYSSYRLLNSLLPARAAEWRQMLIGAGLDPDDASADLATPAGIGNAAGFAVAEGRINDGMNQVGDADGRTFNLQPYSDYTGYRPVNTPEKLRRAGRWQPDIQRVGVGLYKSQQFVTPQYRYVEPYAYPDARRFRVPRPRDSNPERQRAYRRQANAVLDASANLDDIQKLKAELFDNKIESLGFSAVFAALSQGLSLLDFIHLDFLTNMAAFDAGIVIWQEKARHDAVRPFSAIQRIYRDRPVTAWGGVGRGTVDDLPASEWKAYLEEADHPEYPSASACFCAAHAESARRYLGNDQLGYQVSRPAGSSRVEPGITPAADTLLRWDTWTEFAADCGESRIWAGVHFSAAVEASAAICDDFGEMAHAYLLSLIDGSAPERPPSRGTRDHHH
jgi:hypothetical protein